MLVSKGTRPSAPEADRLRNDIKLLQLRTPRKLAQAQVIALAPIDLGDAYPTAQILAQSFARSGVKTLLVDADFEAARETDMPGWREVLAGQEVDLQPLQDNLDLLPIGADHRVSCGTVGTAQLRATLSRLGADCDVILLACGSLTHAVSAELMLAESDFALATLTPNDHKRLIAARIKRFDNLPRQGGAVVFTAAKSNDPGLHG